MSLFADDMIVYIQNRIDPTKKLLDLISDFDKTVGYNSEIEGIFLYTNNEISETNQEKNLI